MQLGASNVPTGTVTALDITVDGASVVRDGLVLGVELVGGGLIAIPPTHLDLGCTSIIATEFGPQYFL